MNSDIRNHSFVCAPGQGQVLAKSVYLKVSSAQTGGAFEAIELDGPKGPSPHMHHDRDECFWIIEGIFSFVLGAEQVEAPAGSVVFVSRGTRHSFIPSQGARALVFVSPGGLEGFFRELGAGLAAGRPEADVRGELADKYDSEPVG